MATELTVPTLGMDMTEATIVRWLVSEGDEVEKGDPVLEIDTDKTSFEVEAPGDGVISNLRGEEGETMEVGILVAYILAPGEDAPEQPAEDSGGSLDPDGDSEAPKSATESSAEQDSLEAEAPQAEVSQGEAPQTEADSADVNSASGKGLRASPAARKLAWKRGIELSEVRGSGPNGRVYLSDVQNFEGSAPAETEAPKAPSATLSLSESSSAPAANGASPDSSQEDGTRREAQSQIRKIGAQRTQQSFAEVPHFYLRRDMDAEGIVALRARLKEKLDPAPSLNDLIAFAVSRTLANHPRLNARFDEGDLVVSESVHLGIAAATDRGLLVPVVKGAERLRLAEITSTTKDLLLRARDGKLGRDELSGGTFTISNLGMMGVDSFDAIINQPEAAILAVGSLRTVPVWDENEWVPHKAISMTLSVDHRVADGADGARFLQELQDGLSNWELLM